MTPTLSFSFFRFPLSRWWMKTQQQIAPLCSAASLHLQDELGVRVRVSTTVHSNRQSSLHPPSSGASFVNTQSPSRRRNYRARRIVSSFSRLATERSRLVAINLALHIASVAIFPEIPARLNENLFAPHFWTNNFYL